MMTKREEELGRITFNAIMRQVKTLTIPELLVLKNFYVTGSAYQGLPPLTRERLLAIALDLIDDTKRVSE